MFTECPECQTTFRLTAQILRQAQGRVRCGGCGSTFNALDNLSEEPPAQDTSDTQTARRFEQESRELLETLDELSAGEDVRIEDTGAEWQVVDGGGDDDDERGRGESAADVEHTATGPRWTFADTADSDERPADIAAADREPGGQAADDAPQGALDLGRDEGGEELRFDDNTPLPEDFYSAGAPRAGRRASDRHDEPRSAGVATSEQITQVDLEFSDVDWQDLLAEVEADDADSRAARVADETAPAAASYDERPELAAADQPPGAADDEPLDAVAVDAAETGERGWNPGEEDRPFEPVTAADEPPLADAESESPAGGEPTEPVAGAAADDDRTAEFDIDRNEDGEDEADDEAGPQDADTAPWYEDPSLVETIVMEGDTFSDTLSAADDDGEEPDGGPAAESADAAEPGLEDGQLAASGARRARAMTARQRYAGIAAIVLLGLLLAGQVVHANRETLATLGLFETTLAPLYAALGKPVTPAWDIRGWQFESTSGSTDESGSRLTIFSRIANRSDSALPYPLVHVSLTDRFDDVIGSRLLAPDEYLAGNARVSRPVAAGDDFTAVITVDAPSADATGFKLNVCYPVAGERVRCAIEDFRD